MKSFRALDQLLNSASSALFAFGLVALTDDRVLGAVTIQLTPLALLLGIARTSVYEGLLLHASERRERSSQVAVAVGLAGASSGAVLSYLTGRVVDTPGSLALGITFVTFAVLVFDGARFAALSRGRSGRACGADASWLSLTAAGLSLLWATGALTSTSLAVVYGGSAILGLAFLATEIVSIHSFRRRDFDTGDARFGVDFLLQIAPGQLALVLAALVTPLADVGVLRAAVTMYSPLATIVYATRLVALGAPGTESGRRTSRIYAATSIGYTALAVAIFGVFDDAIARSLGAIPVGVIALVGAGECVRHISQARVDRLRLHGLLGPATRLRSEQAIVLVFTSVAFGAVSGAAGLAASRLTAFAVPLAASRRRDRSGGSRVVVDGAESADRVEPFDSE